MLVVPTLLPRAPCPGLWTTSGGWYGNRNPLSLSWLLDWKRDESYVNPLNQNTYVCLGVFAFLFCVDLKVYEFV